MRLIIDEAGDGHSDLFLKFDTLTSKLIVADSYFLNDFFGVENSTIKECSLKLLNYWKSIIEHCINSNIKQFLPFGLYDDYVSGFLIKPSKYTFSFTECYSEKLHGYSTSIESLAANLKNIQFEKQDTENWLVSHAQIIDGINWSIEQLKH